MIERRKIAVVGVSVALGLLLLIAGNFERARESAGEHNMGPEGNLKIIALGVMNYAQDHAQHLPALSNRTLLEQQLAAYVPGASAASVESLLWTPGSDIPYLGNPSLSDRKLNTFPLNKETVLLYPARPHSGGRYVPLLDGDVTPVRFIPEAQWQQQTAGGSILSFPDTGPRALWERTW